VAGRLALMLGKKMSLRSKTFDKSLRKIAVPKLIELGFKFDGSRTLRRVRNGDSIVEIVNFQLGLRSQEGKFTANLGVYTQGDAEGISVEKAAEYHCKNQYRIRNKK
jgi:hypothetical protein